MKEVSNLIFSILVQWIPSDMKFESYSLTLIKSQRVKDDRNSLLIYIIKEKYTAIEINVSLGLYFSFCDFFSLGFRLTSSVCFRL